MIYYTLLAAPNANWMRFEVIFSSPFLSLFVFCLKWFCHIANISESNHRWKLDSIVLKRTEAEKEIMAIIYHLHLEQFRGEFDSNSVSFCVGHLWCDKSGLRCNLYTSWLCIYCMFKHSTGHLIRCSIVYLCKCGTSKRHRVERKSVHKIVQMCAKQQPNQTKPFAHTLIYDGHCNIQ